MFCFLCVCLLEEHHLVKVVLEVCDGEEPPSVPDPRHHVARDKVVARRERRVPEVHARERHSR